MVASALIKLPLGLALIKLQFTKKWLGSAADTLIVRDNEESKSAAQIWMFANSAASALIKRPLGLALIKKRPLDLFSNKIGADEMGSLEKGPSAFIKCHRR